MTVRVAAALLILLPACASSLASPIGALTGPFASQVLAQQRQAAANDNAAQPKPDRAGASCHADSQPKRGLDDEATPHCQPVGADEVAVRNRGGLDPLPEPDRKPPGKPIR